MTQLWLLPPGRALRLGSVDSPTTHGSTTRLHQHQYNYSNNFEKETSLYKEENVSLKFLIWIVTTVNDFIISKKCI